MADERSWDDLRSELHEREERLRTEMGGAERVAKVHSRGQLTARERVAELLDADTFSEVGMFARSDRPGLEDSTPGDGMLAGFGKIDGREVAVTANDTTVYAGTSSSVGSERSHRVFQHALKFGVPFVHLGEAGGARIHEMVSSADTTRITAVMQPRARRIPQATAILGQCYGGPSFTAARSDFVVQKQGSVMAVTGPRIIELAVGEKITPEELGGADVHARITGQIDRVAADELEALAAIREFLSFLPPNAWTSPPRAEPDPRGGPDEQVLKIVPRARNRGYDVRRLIRRLVDNEHLFELKPSFGGSMVTCLARIDGHPVGFIASNPMVNAGALDPDTCDKGTQFLCLCDAFNLPVVFLLDVPGFLVGKTVEHRRMLNKAIMFLEALEMARTPKISIMVRKAFGLGFVVLAGPRSGNDLIYAWPSVEIAQLDPVIAANVVHGEAFSNADEETRAEMVANWTRDTSPYGAASIMSIDGIIDPVNTRDVLVRAVNQVQLPPNPKGSPSPLAHWPTCL